MRKKLIALLLSVSVILSGFTPVYAADFTDGGDAFAIGAEENVETEEKTEAKETTEENIEENTEDDAVTEWKSETDEDAEIVLDAGEASEEDFAEEFSVEEDESSLFSEESEMELEAARTGETAQANAGQGVTAGTSVYVKGSSFGQQEQLTALKLTHFLSMSYWGNWASPENISYYIDDVGNLHIVGCENQKLYDATCDVNDNIISTTTVKLPLAEWGGFYAAPDGNFYVAVGQENLNEKDNLTVVKILKYNRAWNLLGTADVKGSVTNVYKGIYIPFDAASLRMTQMGSTLIVHTGREMYELDDGLHHQTDITFVINTDTMELINSKMPYVSHSFNQFVVNDGSHVYFLDHGDAYSRGLVLSSLSSYTQGKLSKEDSVNIFPFMGTTGNNYTGCEVTGFSLQGSTLVTVGKSVPHNQAVGGVTGWDSELNQNVFLILTDKNNLTSRFIWLTQHSPYGKNVKLTEPKLIPVDESRYVILYSEETSKQSVLHYLLMDSSGNVILSKAYKNVTIQTDSQPVLWKKNIIWVTGSFEDEDWEEYDLDKGFLYKIPLVTVPLTGISLDQKNVNVDEGKTVKLNPVFYPSNSDDVKDVVWTSSNPNVAKVSADGTIQAVAYGQAVITAVSGDFQAKCQVKVRIPQTDDPLSVPTLKVSQKDADKMQLSWSKVTGAKGYQIYCKTSSQSSYKKIAAVKDGALTYRANVTTNVKYSFKVRAYGTNKNGKTKYSGFSNVKSKQAIVPAPASVSCGMGEQKITISWSKVEGAAGYVIYRYDHAVKTVKASVLSWGDKDGYSGAGSYWTYEYCVRAYKIVNGKRVYSKKTKTVTI